ncbi:MAG TPA: hypothetical protein ENH50_12140 [Nitrospirae bacterium]|nr:hypothetical protein [Nitrospirota bacterium]
MKIILFYVTGYVRQIRAPLTFTIDFRRVDRLNYQLRTSQVLSVPPEKAFTFFEDPRNLFDTTPDWLDFKMVDVKDKSEVFEVRNLITR